MSEMYRIINFRDFGDERGKLVVIEGEGRDIPFDIKRLFYIYGSDSSVIRGQHANRNSEFLLVNISGSSKIMFTDGQKKEVIELNKPMQGIYIPKMIWKEMFDFSSDSVLLCLANTHYDGSEYIRDFDEYKQIMKNEK